MKSKLVSGSLSSYSLLIAVAVALVALQPQPIYAQHLGPTTDWDLYAGAADTVPTPTRAFVRSLLLPGLGQSAFSAYFRGGVYFATSSTSWYMLLKSHARLGQARDVEERRAAAIKADLLADGVDDPETIANAQANDAMLRGMKDLVESRRQQREDWIAVTLFWTLASALDAFVTAHLYEFPGRVTGSMLPGGTVEVGVSFPLGTSR